MQEWVNGLGVECFHTFLDGWVFLTVGNGPHAVGCINIGKGCHGGHAVNRAGGLHLEVIELFQVALT
ncbi:MAG: hypothetical protein M3120_02185 [Pseudomonadota bacterium]|nr:hypothetical protein [Pseudomonadota bacterium]